VTDRPPSDAVCAEDHCITCGDVAESLTVLRIDADRLLALCSDAGGDHHTVEIALVLPVEAGDELLVHAGTAIA
jgi:hydrogenase maturation factor